MNDIIPDSEVEQKKKLEEAIRPFSNFNLEKFSIGRYLLIGAFQGYIGSGTLPRHRAPAQKTLNAWDMLLLGQLVQRQFKSDIITARDCLESLLINTYPHRDSENVQDFLSTIFSGGDNVYGRDMFSDSVMGRMEDDPNGVRRFENKLQFLTALRQESLTGYHGVNSKTRGQIKRMIEENEDLLEKEPLEMVFYMGGDILDGLGYVSVREKTNKSMALKVLDRYARVLNINDSIARNEYLDSIIVEENGRILPEKDAKSFKKTFTADKLHNYIFHDFLQEFLLSNEDFYDYHQARPGKRSFSYLVNSKNKLHKVTATLSEKLTEAVADFFLVDATGVRISTDPGSYLENLVKDRDEEQLERILSKQFSPAYLLKNGVENNYGREIKDGSMVAKLRGRDPASFVEIRLQPFSSVISSEVDPELGHLFYKQRIQKRVKKSMKLPVMRRAAYNVLQMLEIEDPSEVIPGYTWEKLQN